MNVLSLYQKAQSTVLDARELAWVENEAREHPYFGLPYMISARHHLSQKTTIKDRALLLGAAYSIDRTMLHGYVQDLLQQPRAAKHVSVVAAPVNPFPETSAEPAIAEAADVVTEAVVAPAIAEVPVIIPDAVAEPAVEAATPIVAEALVEPAVAAAPEIIEAVVEPAVEETPAIVAEAIEEPAVEEAPAIVAEAIAAPAFEEAATIVAEAIVAAQPATEAPITYTPRTINWFLNMRMKLRTQKYASLPSRIKAAAASHAPRTEASAATVAQAPAQPQPQMPEVAPATALQAEGGKTTEDGYSIGAFSSFSFVETDDEGPEGLEENLVMTREAISIHTPTRPEENGEIVLEEENRTVEIVVSPELLAKYFNGHLPAAHPAHAPLAVDDTVRMELEFLPQDKVETPSQQLRPSVTPTKRATPSAQDLIDRFIEQEPSIKRQGGGDVPAGDLARNSNVERDEWVTETLARIHAKQGNKNKAIKIYQKLGLLFPEKRDYFAARIAELK